MRVHGNLPLGARHRAGSLFRQESIMIIRVLALAISLGTILSHAEPKASAGGQPRQAARRAARTPRKSAVGNTVLGSDRIDSPRLVEVLNYGDVMELTQDPPA